MRLQRADGAAQPPKFALARALRAARRNVADIARHRTSVPSAAAPRRTAAAGAAPPPKQGRARPRGRRLCECAKESASRVASAAQRRRSSSNSHAHCASRAPRVARLAGARGGQRPPAAYGSAPTAAGERLHQRASAAVSSAGGASAATRASLCAHETRAAQAPGVDGGGEPVAIGDGRGGAARTVGADIVTRESRGAELASVRKGEA